MAHSPSLHVAQVKIPTPFSFYFYLTQWDMLFLCINIFESQRDRETDPFHPLVHSPKCLQEMDWAWLKPGFGTPPHLPCEWHGLRYRGHHLLPPRV